MPSSPVRPHTFRSGRTRRTPLFGFTAALALAGCAPDYADAPFGPGLVIDGTSKGAPPRLLATGDVNGDGLDDIILTVDGNRAFVVFGRATPARLDLSDIAAGDGGFIIEPGDQGPLEWRAFGDVNGDGRLDLAAATAHDKTVVVLGVDTTATIDLDDVAAGIGGFAVEHSAQEHVDAIVDIDGDGFGDLVFGGERSVYVLFGAANLAAPTLDDVTQGVGGFTEEVIDHVCGPIQVVPVGDIDGDGFSDLAATEHPDPDMCGLGPGSTDFTSLVRGRAPGVTPSPGLLYPSGGLYGAVVHTVHDLDGDGLAELMLEGRGGPFTTTPLSSPINGFVVFYGRPTVPDEFHFGYAELGVAVEYWDDPKHWEPEVFEVRGSSDVDGDGRPDILAAYRNDTYVVFAPPKPDVSFEESLVLDLEPAIAPAVGVHLPHAGVVAPADLDGDGLADLIFATPGADAARGQVAVLHGRLHLVSGQAVDDTIAGEFKGDHLGDQVLGADVNGDGLADLVVTAPGADPNGLGSGRVYVIFSGT